MANHKQVGSNNTDLTEMNRSLIVQILQHRGICSRVEIAKITGLTQAAITKIVAVLIDIGIVSETGVINGKRGRRSIGLQLNAKEFQVIGVKFARQVASVGVFDISGCAYTHQNFYYRREEHPAKVLSDIKNQIAAYEKIYPNIVAMGIAVPGPYLRKQGRIATVTGMPRWHDINFRDEFKYEYSFPVYLEHDANAGALAEWLFGNRESTVQSLVYYLVGEGVGAGIVERGEVLMGKLEFRREVGHISIDVNGPSCECGNHGCLELYCSAYAVERAVREKCPEILKPEDDTPQRICERLFECARANNQTAVKIVEQIAYYIGCGCVNVMNAYNPEVIAIGDILSTGLDLMMDTIQSVVNERVFGEVAEKTIIRRTSLETDAILSGAAALATNEVLRLPSAFSKKTTLKEGESK